VAQRYGWGVGFALPAVGMALGLAQFALTRKHLGAAGLQPAAAATHSRASWTPILIGGALLVLVVALGITGAVKMNAVAISDAATWVIFAFAAFYFVYLGFFAGLNLDERKRVAWAIVGQQFHHYSGAARVDADQDGSRFIWTADLLPDEFAGKVEEMMSAGIEVAKQTLETAAGSRT
jgi:hypothetical protein